MFERPRRTTGCWLRPFLHPRISTSSEEGLTRARAFINSTYSNSRAPDVCWRRKTEANSESSHNMHGGACEGRCSGSQRAQLLLITGTEPGVRHTLQPSMYLLTCPFPYLFIRCAQFIKPFSSSRVRIETQTVTGRFVLCSWCTHGRKTQQLDGKN